MVSIKREKSGGGITGGKEYPVAGFGGGCVIIVDDDNRFVSLSFAHISDEWTIPTGDAKPAKSAEPAKTKS